MKTIALCVVLLLISVSSFVSGQCIEDADIAEGGYHDIGVNGTQDPPVYDSNNINTPDFTWTVPENWTYPMGLPDRRGQANFLDHYTCSRLKFCLPAVDNATITRENSTVYQMPSKDAFENCDFTNATLIGYVTNTTCVTIERNEMSLLGVQYYYADMQNCMKDQKVAVEVTDWTTSAAGCARIADEIPATSRVRGCDCMFEKKKIRLLLETVCIRLPEKVSRTGTAWRVLRNQHLLFRQRDFQHRNRPCFRAGTTQQMRRYHTG